MRRDFTLPMEDEEYLDAEHYYWETIDDTSSKRLVISDFPIPLGYNHDKVKINIRVDGYPASALDMVYVLPHLSLLSKKPIGALGDDVFDGETWQRWSRHNTPDDPWRPGVDDISTHTEKIKNWFQQELL